MIEVLVVSANMVLLMALLLPAVRQARDVAHQRQCQLRLAPPQSVANWFADFRPEFPSEGRPASEVFASVPDRSLDSRSAGWISTRLPTRRESVPENTRFPAVTATGGQENQASPSGQSFGSNLNLQPAPAATGGNGERRTGPLMNGVANMLMIGDRDVFDPCIGIHRCR